MLDFTSVALRETGQTHLHLYAKAILKDRMVLTLPPACVSGCGDLLCVSGEQDVEITDLLVEKKRGSIIPDAICKVGGQEVAVEFAMTHKVSEAKREIYAGMGLSAVEIDISKMWDVDDPEDQVAQVLHLAPRSWIYNRVTGGIEASLSNMDSASLKRLSGQVRDLVQTQAERHGSF